MALLTGGRVKIGYQAGLKLLRAGVQLQELLGHSDVSTTQIYTHVMQKPGIGVKSPLDS